MKLACSVAENQKTMKRLSRKKTNRFQIIQINNDGVVLSKFKKGSDKCEVKFKNNFSTAATKVEKFQRKRNYNFSKTRRELSPSSLRRTYN